MNCGPGSRHESTKSSRTCDGRASKRRASAAHTPAIIRPRRGRTSWLERGTARAYSTAPPAGRTLRGDRLEGGGTAVGDEREPDQEDTRRDDEQALEEIRQLFARYRRIARHGVVAERTETVEEADEAARA